MLPPLHTVIITKQKYVYYLATIKEISALTNLIDQYHVTIYINCYIIFIVQASLYKVLLLYNKIKRY